MMMTGAGIGMGTGKGIRSGARSATYGTTTLACGTGIIVFGTVPASNETVLPPSAVYLLDADPPFATSAPFAPASVPNQPMFASGQLAAGREHSLVINVTSAETPYILQRFFVFPRPPAQKDTIGQLPSGSSRGQNPAATATSPPTPSATSQTLNSNSPDPGAQQAVRALAAVLGTLAFLIIACIIIFLFLRFSTAQAVGGTTCGGREMTYGSQVGSRRSRRPETVYTTFTSTESILRNDSVWSPSHRSTRSHFSRGDGYRSEGRNTIDFTPPPLPPKPGRVSSPNTVGSGTT
ncbi:hypothetical protein NLJ89_g1686 [Agrocybe chaxingu]|uniref:Uncharacterized protein n=1 Tax=Agrocybe chaxingu TaxID=84603 RepID=A0A9W8TD08_9AGAR|nr:hypothetical protein NLJ89_g1686 [Agrocybe chaxingu]